MKEFYFCLKAKDKSEEYRITSTQTVQPFVDALLEVFQNPVDFKNNIIFKRTNTSEFKKTLEHFVILYRDKFPVLFSIQAFFNSLVNDESFYFLPYRPDIRTNYTIGNYFRAITEGQDFIEMQNQMDQMFKNISEIYKMNEYGRHHIKIGEPLRKKRVCRFCNNTRIPLSFSNLAHAISEALGNKTVILHDECDGCNKEFGKTIEIDIINYLAFQRTIFGIKGKGGEKKFAHKNGEISTGFDSDLQRVLDKRELELPTLFKFDSLYDICDQNIYKALCKYFLSVINTKELVHFLATIDWINNANVSIALPKVAILMIDNIAMQPTMVTYIQKSSNKVLPFAIGEFHFAAFKFVFIVPFTNVDIKSFVATEEYDTFWNTFTHYNRVSGWQFINFASPEKRPFSIHLKIEKNTEVQL